MSVSIRGKLALAALVWAPTLALAGMADAKVAEAAEGGDDSSSAFRLEPVVVTGAAPVSALTFELDPKAPRQPVPASDGADYLKTIPGFSALRNGGTNGDPVLRGMFGSRLNILANDGAMQGACPARMDNSLSYVAPETYDRLIVIKGPQSVLWGPGASAGTVRFERDTAYFDQPGWRLEGSALGGSWGRNDQVFDVAAGAPGGFARLSANRSESGDYEDGDGLRVPSRWNKWNADAVVGWTPDADTRLEATLGRGDGEARYAGRGMDGSQFKRESAGLKFSKKNIGGALDAIEANVYSNYADHVMDNYSLRDPDPHGSMPMAMATNVDRRTSGARVATSWVVSQVLLSAGIDHQGNRHRSRSGMHDWRAQPWLADAEFSNTGVFAEANWTFAEGQRLIGGARVDRAAVEDLRASSGGMMPMPNPSAGVTRHETLPGGFLRYERDLDDRGSNLYAGLGHVQRMPDYWELFSPTIAPMGAANAFLGIAPEKTTQLDIGAQYNGDNVRAWVSLYVGRVQDFILFRYHPADMGDHGGHDGHGGMDDGHGHDHGMGGSAQALNVDASTRGGELGVSWRFAPAWKSEASVVYARGENRSDRSPLPQMPPLEARFTLGYDNSAWSFAGLWRLVARQDRIALGEGNVVGRDLGPAAAFGVLSFNGGYRFSPRWQLSAGIDNVFNRTYAEHLNLAGNAAFGYPAEQTVGIHEPGRMLWTKLQFAF